MQTKRFSTTIHVWELDKVIAASDCPTIAIPQITVWLRTLDAGATKSKVWVWYGCTEYGRAKPQPYRNFSSLLKFLCVHLPYDLRYSFCLDTVSLLIKYCLVMVFIRPLRFRYGQCGIHAVYMCSLWFTGFLRYPWNSVHGGFC